MLGHVTLFVFLLPRIEIVMRNRKLNWCGLSKLFIDEFKAANAIKHILRCLLSAVLILAFRGHTVLNLAILWDKKFSIREPKVRLRIKKSNETHWDSNQQPLASLSNALTFQPPMQI